MDFEHEFSCTMSDVLFTIVVWGDIKFGIMKCVSVINNVLLITLISMSIFQKKKKSNSAPHH